MNELLAGQPAVLLVGPRACGKTTTARRQCRGVIRLDRPAEANAARADPDAVIADGPFPLLVDEWQLVPDVLGAIKRAVDDDSSPGRFVITGSSQADLTSAGWPGTGRVIRVALDGLTERELVGSVSGPPLLDRLIATGFDVLPPSPSEPPDSRGYVSRALRGGFPELALANSETVRRRWLASYVDQVVSRDVAQVGAVRDPLRLRRFLQTIAANTAGTPTLQTLLDSVGIDRATAMSYDTMLEQLFVTERVPAWSNNRLQRLVRLPKRYLVEPAFLVPLLGADARGTQRDGHILGRLLDTFVLAQLRADGVVSELGPRFFHVRDANGRHEVDLVVELPDGRIVGIEVKAGATPVAADADHLRWLRRALGDRFVGGVVFHAGPRCLRLAPDILALPICLLWSAA